MNKLAYQLGRELADYHFNDGRTKEANIISGPQRHALMSYLSKIMDPLRAGASSMDDAARALVGRPNVEAVTKMLSSPELGNIPYTAMSPKGQMGKYLLGGGLGAAGLGGLGASLYDEE